MNDTPLAEPAAAAAKASPRHHVWDDSWIGVFILMLIAAALGGLLSRLWPGGDGLFSTPAGELSEKVAALDARLIQLTNANSGPGAADLTAIRARVTQLEERVKAAETALASNPADPTPAAAAETPATPSGPASLDALAKQVQELQARFAVLELGAKVSGTVQTGAAPAPTELQAVKEGLAKANETVAALATRFEEIKTKMDAAADPSTLIAGVRGDLDGVKARIDKIEKSDPAGASRRAALGAAVASLSRAAQSGQPFQSELAVVRGLQPADASLAALAAFANKGAPVLAALQSSFSVAADAAVKAERDAQAGEGLDRLWSGVTSMVSVRATGTPGGADTASVLARAETKLKAGDLKAAYDETGKLHGPARTAIDPWRREAEARIKLDTAISSLSRAIADSLSRSAAAAP